jgi:hypothetical protein
MWMKLDKPKTENERLLASVLLVFVVYFGINSIIFAFYGEGDGFAVRYFMTLSFFGGMLAGILFFLWSRPEKKTEGGSSSSSPMERNLYILERALSRDEALILRMIASSEGITQDSLRFRTGFSKSKVSALILGLEKNGIIYRERLGRTYKLSMADWLKKK